MQIQKKYSSDVIIRFSEYDIINFICHGMDLQIYKLNNQISNLQRKLNESKEQIPFLEKKISSYEPIIVYIVFYIYRSKRMKK